MREIKFRFFSNITKKMTDEVTMMELHWKHESDPSIYTPGKVTVDGITRVQKYSDGYLMQFTGLHDKNGKEIYEGDVVSRVWCKNEESRVIREVIQFDVGAFWCSFGVGGPLLGPHLASVKTSQIEVIGNIYENPSLLEVQP